MPAILHYGSLAQLVERLSEEQKVPWFDSMTSHKGGKMYIDYADLQQEIDKLVSYWSEKIRSLGAESVAGVTKKNYAKGKWAVDLIVYVSEDSKAYQDFIKRFGR